MNETIEDIVAEMRSDCPSRHMDGTTYLDCDWVYKKGTVKGLADRIEAALKRARSQTKEKDIKYEYAIQEKFKENWLTTDSGFPSLDEVEGFMKDMCNLFPNERFRIVRRPAEWEVVE